MRNEHLHFISMAYKDMSCYDDKVRMWALMISFLSPDQRKVFEFCTFSTERVVTSDVQSKFNWSKQYASTLLKELFDIDLLGREMVIDERGKFYTYFVNKV